MSRHRATGTSDRLSSTFPALFGRCAMSSRTRHGPPRAAHDIDRSSVLPTHWPVPRRGRSKRAGTSNRVTEIRQDQTGKPTRDFRHLFRQPATPAGPADAGRGRTVRDTSCPAAPAVRGPPTGFLFLLLTYRSVFSARTKLRTNGKNVMQDTCFPSSGLRVHTDYISTWQHGPQFWKSTLKVPQY